jgi:hypothetical protein
MDGARVQANLTLARRGRLFLTTEVEDGFFAFVRLVVALAANEPPPIAPRFDW